MSNVREGQEIEAFSAKPIVSQDRDEAVQSTRDTSEVDVPMQIAFLATHEEPSPEHIEKLKAELVNRQVDLDILKARAKKDDPADTQAVQEPLPDMFKSLRTVILARDCGDDMKVSAAKALLNVFKTGTERAVNTAQSVLIELLTHERLRGRQ